MFIGPSGKLLDAACRAGGVPRAELAILNAAACGPIPSGADDIKKRTIAACRPRLLRELQRLQPNVLLAIGGLALKALAPMAPGGVTALRGALLDIADDVGTRGAWNPLFLASLHPAYILRGGDGDGPDAPGAEGSRSVDLQFYFLLYDLSKAWRLATGRARPWQDNCDLFLLHNRRLRRATVDDAGKPCIGDLATPEEFVEAMQLVEREAAARGAFSCDVETDAKDSLEANLTAIGFSTVDGGCAATWAAFQAVPEALAIARRLLASAHAKWFWSRIYDCIVLPRHGLPVANPIDDGLLLHHAAFPGLPHKLDAAAQQFLCVSAWKTEFRKSTKNEAELLVYNYRDAAATMLIPEPLATVARAHRTERVYEADRQVVAIAQYMREFGFWIDRKEQARQSKIQHARLEYMQGELEAQFAAIAPAWFDRLARNLAVGQRQRDPDGFLDRVELRKRELAQRPIAQTDIPTGIRRVIEQTRLRKGVRVVVASKECEVHFKPKAKADLVALFEVLRIPFLSYTPKGSPVTDKKSMETVAAKHPLMRQLIHIREAQHILATYIDGLPIKRTGRVHPDWSVVKISGRWSAGKSQNIPKQVAGWPPEEEPDPTYLPPLEEPHDGTNSEDACAADVRNDVDRRDELRAVAGPAHSPRAGGGQHRDRGAESANSSRDVPQDGSEASIALGPRAGFRWKRKPNSGDYVCPIENARALITAPTVAEILAHALVEPTIYLDLRYAPIYGRAVLGHGRMLVGADMNQLELRIAALLGRDPFLLNAYATGADVHAMNAGVCFPKVFPKLAEDFKALAMGTAYGYAKPLTLKADLYKLDKLSDEVRAQLLRYQKPWSKLRDLAKRLVYAWIYRGRAETAYQSLVKEFPELELSAVIEAFKLLDQKILGWVAWCARNEIAVRQNREVREALLNRVRLFPLGNYDVNIATNFPVQAFGASLIIFSLFRYYAVVDPSILELDKLYEHRLLDRAWVETKRAEDFDRWVSPPVPTINGHDAITVECDEEDAISTCSRCAAHGYGPMCKQCEAPLPPGRMLRFLEACMEHTITIDDATMRFFAEAAVGRRLSET